MLSPVPPPGAARRRAARKRLHAFSSASALTSPPRLHRPGAGGADARPPQPPGPKNRRFALRLGFALAGLRLVLAREKSFRTQAVLAAAAFAFLLLLRPGPLWTALVILSAALVLALELVNSALEYLLDRLHPDHCREIGAAKDAAAAAVLLASLAALLVGMLMAADTLLG